MGDADDAIRSSLELLETTRAQIGAGRVYKTDVQDVLRQTCRMITSSQASIVETDRTMQRWWYCSGQPPPLASSAPAHDEERHEEG